MKTANGRKTKSLLIGSEASETSETSETNVVLAQPLFASDINETVDQILFGILKELPFYSPIHRAVRQPLVKLLKKAGVGVPGGDGPAKKDDPDDPHN